MSAWLASAPANDSLLINAPAAIRANWDAIALGTDAALLITNAKVSASAAIVESKILFSGTGHAHTGTTNGIKIALATAVSGVLPVVNGGTGVDGDTYDADKLDGQHGAYYNDLANASGTLAIARGGLNITTYTVGDILYCSATNVLAKLAKGTDGQVLKQGASIPAWGTALSFGSRAARTDNTEYQATTDGYFIGIIIAGANASAGRIIAYIDTTSPPTTVLGGASVVVVTDVWSQSAYTNYNSFCIPVKSGNYYKGVKSSTGNAPTVTYWWISIS